MMLSYFQDLAAGLQARLEQDDPSLPRARKRLALEIARLGVDLYSGEAPVAWCGVLAPFELLRAVGVTSCFAEFIGAMLSSTGAVDPMLAEAEAWGYPPDTCSYHRAVMGAALKGQMPKPAFLVGTTAPCSGGVALIENLARHFDRELFILDIPGADDPSARANLARQLEALACFAAEKTGRPLDPERLAATMGRTNRTRQLLLEVYQLAAASPTPARRRDLVNFGLVIALLMGSSRGEEIAQVYRDEFKGKVEQGSAGVQDEDLRLLWLQNRIQFQHPLEELLEREHDAAIVADELNCITWGPVDEVDPFEGLAARILSFPFVGSARRRIDNLRRMAREAAVDGAINPCHWGCRQGTGARGLIAEALKADGVPVLNLEVDCVDPRNFSEGQLVTRIEAFCEMLRSRRRTRDTAKGGA